MAMTTLGVAEQRKKEAIEVLKIIKKCRAKSVDDERNARVYYPGEEGRFQGSAKLQLLAMQAATRDLDYEVESNEKEDREMPDLSAMDMKELDAYASDIGLDTSKFMNKKGKISAIKKAVK